MELNLNQLRTVWAVLGAGSVGGAARRLGVGPSAVSMQVKKLEELLGEPLFERTRTGLRPTAFGRLVAGYVEPMFELGTELEAAIEGRVAGRPRSLRLGIANGVSTFVASTLLSLECGGAEGSLEVRRGTVAELQGALGRRELDCVVSDHTLEDGPGPRPHAHSIGRSELGFFGAPELATRLRESGVEELANVPLVLPSQAAAVRRSIDDWFAERGLEPRVALVLDDSALGKLVAARSDALFTAPIVTAGDLRETVGVEQARVLDGVHEGTWLLTLERRLVHPLAERLLAIGRERFGSVEA